MLVQLVLVYCLAAEPSRCVERRPVPEQPGLRMRPGRGENVLAYGSHYGRDFIHHMRPAYLSEIITANLRRPA